MSPDEGSPSVFRAMAPATRPLLRAADCDDAQTEAVSTGRHTATVEAQSESHADGHADGALLSIASGDLPARRMAAASGVCSGGRHSEQFSGEDVADTAGLGAEGHDSVVGETPEEERVRLRRLQQQERRRALRDKRFAPPELDGLTSRDFEIDLLQGEEFRGNVLKVKLKKSMTRCQRVLRGIATLGFYEVWVRCCSSGAHVFEDDARLVVTTRGRLLLWSFSATGGGTTCKQRCVKAVTGPAGILSLISLIFFICVFPAIPALANEILELGGGLVGAIGAVLMTLLFQALLDRMSLNCITSVRQFDARDISLVRVVCYSHKDLCGLGDVTVVEAQMYFGIYPKPETLSLATPLAVYDSGCVRTGAFVSGEQQSQQFHMGSDTRPASATGASAGEQLIRLGAALVVFLAFLAFVNEMCVFFLQWISCIQQALADGYDSSDLSVISDCIHHHFVDWWTGSKGTDLLTILAHWIETADWTVQLMLFMYTAGPMLSLLAMAMTDRSAANIRFLIDRRGGIATEDEHFQEHWEALCGVLSDLFGRACPAPLRAMPSDVLRGTGEDATAIAGGEHAGWEEIPGDVIVQDGQAAWSSWQQVEEMNQKLLDRRLNKVRIYTGALGWLTGERVLAAYPTYLYMPLLSKLLVVLTCSLEYWLRWHRVRRESAVILTDRRVIEISSCISRRSRSLKMDLFVVDNSLKYASIAPPRHQCCRAPAGIAVISSRCGNLQITFGKLRYSLGHARRFWQGLALLQALDPIATTTLDTFLTGDGASSTGEADGGVFAGLVGRLGEMCLPGRGSVGGNATNGGLNGGSGALPRSSRPSRLSSAIGRPSWRPSNPAARPSAEMVTQMVTTDGDGRAIDHSGIASTPADVPQPQVASQQDEPEMVVCGPPGDPWGIALAVDEYPIWGPVLFEEDLQQLWCRERARGNRRRPSAAVVITSHRLIVLRYRSIGFLGFAGICARLCYYTLVDTVTTVPLCWVLGFYIREKFITQTSTLARVCKPCCCRVPVDSTLTIKVLSNAGLGKAYLRSLAIEQHTMPRTSTPRLSFEDDKVNELRRWLGHVSLFYPEGSAREPIDLIRTENGWSPM